jgi:hypothetical protein
VNFLCIKIIFSFSLKCKIVPYSIIQWEASVTEETLGEEKNLFFGERSVNRSYLYSDRDN